MRFYDKAIIPGMVGYQDVISPDEAIKNYTEGLEFEVPSFVYCPNTDNDGTSVYRTEEVAFADQFAWSKKKAVTNGASVIPFSSTTDINSLMANQDTLRAIEINSLSRGENDEILNLKIYPTDGPYTRAFKSAMNSKQMCLPKYRDRIGDTYANDVRSVARDPEEDKKRKKSAAGDGDPKQTDITNRMVNKFCRGCDISWKITFYNTSPNVANPMPYEVTAYSDGRVYLGDELLVV